MQNPMQGLQAARKKPNPTQGALSTPGTPMDMSTQGRLGTVSGFITGQEGSDSFSAMAAMTGGQGRSGDAIQNAQQSLQVDRGAFTQQALQTQREQESADAAERGEMGQAVQQFSNTDPFDDKTLDELNRLNFANIANAAGAKFMEQMGGVTAMLGAAGIPGGGVGAGLAAQAANSRFQTIVNGQAQAMASNKTNQLTMRAAHAMGTLEARSRYAAVLGKDVPTTSLEAFKNLVDLDLAQLGVAVGYKASSEAAAAQRDAGKMALIGNIAGGVLGGVL